MNRFLRLSAAFAAVLALSGPAQADEKKLTGAEIVKLLAGHTLISLPGQGQAAQSFDASGVTIYQSAEKNLQGRWKVVGDKYCSAWDENSAPKCSDVYAAMPSVIFVGADGEKTVLLFAK